MKAGIEVIDINLILDGATNESSLLSSAFGKELVPLVKNDKYHSYRVSKPHKIRNTSFNLSLFFENGLLKSVHISPNGIGASSWSDATIDKLKEVKAYNDKWLKNELGVSPNTTFSWGNIDSTYDEKGWVAEIVYRFF